MAYAQSKKVMIVGHSHVRRASRFISFGDEVELKILTTGNCFQDYRNLKNDPEFLNFMPNVLVVVTEGNDIVNGFDEQEYCLDVRNFAEGLFQTGVEKILWGMSLPRTQVRVDKISSVDDYNHFRNRLNRFRRKRSTIMGDVRYFNFPNILKQAVRDSSDGIHFDSPEHYKIYADCIIREVNYYFSNQ